jgi:hypothetical protein
MFRGLVVASAVGADKVHMDFWNGSVGDVLVRSLKVFPVRSVAVSGVLAARLLLQRTTTVGTGGTAATAESTSLTAPTLAAFDAEKGLSIPSGISMRAAPSGGAAAGALVALREMFMEETAAYADMQEYLTAPYVDKGLVVHNDSGLRLIQSSVATVGAFHIELEFETGVLLPSRQRQNG